jgi:hypothetical protein
MSNEPVEKERHFIIKAFEANNENTEVQYACVSLTPSRAQAFLRYFAEHVRLNKEGGLGLTFLGFWDTSPTWLKGIPDELEEKIGAGDWLEVPEALPYQEVPTEMDILQVWFRGFHWSALWKHTSQEMQTNMLDQEFLERIAAGE